MPTAPGGARRGASSSKYRIYTGKYRVSRTTPGAEVDREKAGQLGCGRIRSEVGIVADVTGIERLVVIVADITGIN